MLQKIKNWWAETDLDGIWKNFSVVGEEIKNWAANMKRTNLPRFQNGNWFGDADHESYFHLAMNLISETVRDLRRTLSYTIAIYLVYSLLSWIWGLFA